MPLEHCQVHYNCLEHSVDENDNEGTDKGEHSDRVIISILIGKFLLDFLVLKITFD